MHDRIRTIVLSGATRGLGRELLARFIASGHRVVACARSESGVRALRSQFGNEHLFTALDVADASRVEDWAAESLQRFGAPDLLLNNAALINEPATLWQVSSEEFDRVLAVNVSGTANLVRAFVPAMIEHGRGVVVNFSSGWGRSTSPDVGPYCASKYAIEGFTSSLAQELPAGVAAASLNPGIIDTDMLRKTWADGASKYEDAASWADRAAPWLLALDASCNGQALTAP